MGALFPNRPHFSFKSDAEVTKTKLAEVRAAKPDRVQVDIHRSRLTARGWRALDDGLFKLLPDLWLRVYAGTALSAAFLEQLPHVRRLVIESKQLGHAASLSQLPELSHLRLVVDDHEDGLGFLRTLAPALTHLTLARNSAPKLKADVSVLADLPRLRQLGLEGHGDKLSALLPALPSLEDLALSASGPVKGGLGFLQACRRLRKLRLKACAIDDLSALAMLPQLACLSLSRVGKLRTFDVISAMTGLQLLSLHTVNQPIAFPDVRKLTRLRRVVLNALESLRDFSAFKQTTSVEEVAFYDIKSQQPEDFVPLFQNRSIKRLYLWSLRPSYRKQLDATMTRHERSVERLNIFDDSDFSYA